MVRLEWPWRRRPPAQNGVPMKRDPVDRLPAASAVGCALVLVFVFQRAGDGTGLATVVFLLGAAAAGWTLLPWQNAGWLARRLYVAACAAFAAVLAVRVAGTGIDVSDADLHLGMVALAVWAFVAGQNRLVHRGTRAYPMASPFARGRYLVLQGGAAIANHHAGTPNQRFALDLVRVRPIGPRIRGVVARGVEDYLCYGEPLLSPVSGRVVLARDGLPDLGPALPLYGNCLFIEPDDRPGWQVRIGHLRPGSVRVSTGEHVTRGQPVGEIGNSGNSSEPHLHIHVEDEQGRGVPMTIGGRRRPLWRYDRLGPDARRAPI